MPQTSSASPENNRPATGLTGRLTRFFRSRAAWVSIAVAAAVLAVFFAGRASVLRSGAVEASNGRITLRPGPWGVVEYLPITIAPPRKLLRVQAIEDEAMHWYFTGMDRAGFTGLLAQLGISDKLRAALTAPGVMTAYPQGVRLDPTCGMVQDLEPPARKRLYEILANHTENNPHRWEFLTTYLETFPKFNVSRHAASTLEAVSVHNGRHMVTYGMSCVLAELPDQEEKVGLIKALSQQRSMLVRLRVRPDTDVQALAAYWGRGMWTTDVEAILESIQQRPDGGAINVLELLPPLAAALLHSYPTPHNFMSGPEVVKNCSWTAFNFFRDTPKPEFSNEDFVLKTLAEDYYPVLSDPRYGDIAVFLTPERTMRHVAVFLADNLFFTKNGENPWHPWVYSTKEDLLENFSFGLAEGQSLSIHYFRSKAY